MAALDQAKELLDNYWDRDTVKVWSDEDGSYVTDVAHDAVARQAELQTIIAYALIDIAETLCAIRDKEK